MTKRIPGLLQHYTIKCDGCQEVVEWIYLMGSGWRNCPMCRAKNYDLPIQCNLCSQSFDVKDPDIELRMKKHEAFHHLPIRNIVHGNVRWI